MPVAIIAAAAPPEEQPPVTFPHRCLIFCPSGKAGTANTAAKNWDPDTGGQFTFLDVKLSPLGILPATHLGCDTRATEAMKLNIELLRASQPGVLVYWESDGWTPVSALLNAGLKVITPLVP